MENSQQRAKGLIFFSFAFFGLAIYHRNLGSGLVSDDFGLLGRLNSGGFYATWGEGVGGFFRPLTIASFWLDSWAWQGNATVMHLENVLLHAANSTLVFLITQRVLRNAAWDARWLAAGAGVLFLAHPSHSEAVSWVSGRGDLLTTFFVLLCLFSGLEYMHRGGRKLLAASALALIAGLLCKESALAGPGMLVALAGAAWWIPETRRYGTRVLALAGVSLVATTLYLMARYFALGALLTGNQGASRLAHGMGSLLGSFKRQLLRTIFPAVDADATGSLIGFLVIAVLVLLGAGLVIRTVLATEQARPFWITLAALAVAYSAALLPVVGSRVSITDSEGERLIYLATVPYAIAVTCAAAFVKSHAPRSRSAGALLYTLGAVGAVLLQTPTTRWQRAGEYAQETIQVIRNESRGRRILLLNLPDSYEGAFVFRNGIDEALDLSEVKSSEEDAFDVDILTRCAIQRVGVVAQFGPSADHPGYWHLEVPEASAVFRPHKRDLDSTSEFDSAGHYFLSRSDLSNYTDVFLFEGHSLKRVDANL